MVDYKLLSEKTKEEKNIYLVVTYIKKVTSFIKVTYRKKLTLSKSYSLLIL